MRVALMDGTDETYLLLLLSDSNLPTGAFVASSGLESYLKHGVAGPSSSAESRVVAFLRDSLSSYGRTTLPFVTDAHRVVTDFIPKDEGGDDKSAEVVEKLLKLDEWYEAQTLNHVTRRASKAQGVALLTLYTKGFSRPASLNHFADPASQSKEKGKMKMVDQFKLRVRRGDTSGHLPVCWGILTASLGLTLDRAQYLHLFLNARSLLSAAIRLNEVGPYNAQQILLHAAQPLIADEVERCKDLRSGLLEGNDSFDEVFDGPASTWPLGEILSARHDLQHSRIFNS
ncbi:urease accessory protein UreF [Coprinopsis sp. MPI-PUGE-AT-0042]|nr:urease accessory protein UreF [Coprinopsis sp. MPI-PUGE-AT-0042]